MNKLKLKSVSKLITKGTTPSTVGKSFKSSGIKFIKSESIQDSKFLNKSVFAFIDVETDDKLKRSRIEEDDLLFSIAGAYLGKIAIVQKEDVPSNTNQAVGIVRIDRKKAEVNYLYYYFSQKNINQYINKLSSQSSQPNLNLELLGNLEFNNVSLSTQQKIAAVLSTLDDKIELNNKINAELEAMAKTLYDYWFVQFDFPDDNGKPYKSSGGKMVYNEILKREIPEGWEVKKLSEFGNFKNGINYDPKEKGDCLTRIINVRNISNSRIFIDENDLDEIELKLNDVKKYLVNDKSIIIARSGIPGATRLIKNYKKNTIYCGFVIQLEVKQISWKNIIFFNLKHFEKNITSQSNGTIMQNVNQQVLKELRICLPLSPEIVSTFDNIIIPVFSKITNCNQKNQELSTLRDWLLPMLMNGQVSVGRDYEQLEEVLSVAAEDPNYIINNKLIANKNW